MASASRRGVKRKATGQTGPRTATGKARSCRNALRHGLEAVRFDEAGLAEEIRAIVRLICPDADPSRRDHATAIAESQVILRRVRAARIRAIERLRGQGIDRADAGYDCGGIDTLRRLERYERRALSRRRRAIAMLEALTLAG